MINRINPGLDAHQPPSPREEGILGFPAETLATDMHGLYHRRDTTRSDEVLEELSQLVDVPQRIPIQLYQAWAELGWKTQHGTGDSLVRFTEKLFEEFEELSAAVEDYAADQTAENRGALLEELGDVLWCTLALTSNSGRSLESPIKNLVGQYVQGIRWVRPGPVEVEPTWRSSGVEVATKFDHLEAGDLDHLFESGFEPTRSAIMNLHEEGYDYEFVDDVVTEIGWMVGMMITAANIQYTPADKTTLNQDYILAEEFINRGDIVASRSAYMTLLCMHLGWRLAAIFPSDVIAHNVLKVSGRMKRGRIDKADGDRSAESE